MSHYKKLEDTYEFFSIVNTPMGSGGISGHQSPPQAPPSMPQAPVQRPIQPQPLQTNRMPQPQPSQVKLRPAPPQSPEIQIQQSPPERTRRRDRYPFFPKHHRPYVRNRNYYYYNYPSPYYYYYPYSNYYYRPIAEPNDKCFCQDTNLMGAIPNKIVCGQSGCGVCIDRYLCDNCNDNVLCKRYF